MSYETTTVKLSEVIDLISGGTPKTSIKEYWDGKIDWLSVVDFNNGNRYVSEASKKITELGLKNSATNLLNANDIIISARGTVGAIAQLEKSMAFNQSCYGVRGRDGISDTSYIYYVLKNAVKRLKEVSHGAVFDTITKDTFELINVDIPSLLVQKKIVSLLGCLDDKIMLLQKTNKTLEAIAQATFKSWFVDFDPVHANQQGKECAGIDKATADLFPDCFVESELGFIPKGWKVASIYEIAEIIYGAPFSSKLFNSDGNGIPILRIRDLKDENPVVYTTEKHIKGYLLKQGDIVVGMDGEFRAYLWGGNEVWLNQRVCVFKPLPNVSSAYVHLSIKPLLAMVEASETATTVIHIGKNDFDRFKIMIPSNHILDRFAELIDPVYKLIVNNKQSIKSLASLRDTLLPRLMSGKLDLSNIEEELEGVA